MMETASEVALSARHLDSTRQAATDKGVHWIPINPETPLGVKMQLINRLAGVATSGMLPDASKHFTHWAPFPTFKD